MSWISAFVPVLAQIFLIAVTLMFLAMNGHLVMIEVIVEIAVVVAILKIQKSYSMLSEGKALPCHFDLAPISGF